MRTTRSRINVGSVIAGNPFKISAAAMLLMALVPMARAQSVNFEPAALAKQRTEICLKATHAPIADLENEVNHLAVLSETCRAEYGAKACGVPDKPLESNELEDRYAYYVRKPVEAHFTVGQAKIDKHNWEATRATASR